jgi:hypothetical protein
MKNLKTLTTVFVSPASLLDLYAHKKIPSFLIRKWHMSLS